MGGVSVAGGGGGWCGWFLHGRTRKRIVAQAEPPHTPIAALLVAEMHPDTPRASPEALRRAPEIRERAVWKKEEPREEVDLGSLECLVLECGSFLGWLDVG